MSTIWKGGIRGSRRRPGGRGQAVVEFALVMVFFLLFLLAVIDLGRAYFTVVALENAAAEGALYGMANPSCIHEGDCGQYQSVEYRVRYESQNALLDPDQVTFQVEMDAANPGTPGTMIRVTVTYPFRPILPILSAFGSDTIILNEAADELIP